MNVPRNPARKFARFHFAARGWILAAALLVLLLARAATDAGAAPLRPAWLLLVLCGIVLRMWAGAHLGFHGNAARAQAPELATGGPYRFSRNPIYLSNILVAAGLVLYADAFSIPVSALFVLAIILHHAVLVRHEERVLSGLFGDAYDVYRRNAPRWIGFSRGEKREHNDAGASLKTTGIRQGRNVAYALACVFLVWIASRWS
jgi:protein-S-isoprenylcysteine O-methyltransferase Ste14